MSVSDFRDYCKEYALDGSRSRRDSSSGWLCAAIGDHPYLTLHPTYEAQQIRVFGEMVKPRLHL